MARYDDDYGHDYEDRPRRTRATKPRAGFLDTATNLMAIGAFVAVAWLAWPFLSEMFKLRVGLAPDATTQPTSAHRAVGNQAPPEIRSTNGYSASTPLPNVAQNAATADVQYQRAIDAQSDAAPAATPLPAALPLNSAGAPIIDQRQQQQQAQALQLAADEAASAARNAQLADAASRPPDVSADAVATMTGRNPCSVPRADPATCATGLYKPTPVQEGH